MVCLLYPSLVIIVNTFNRERNLPVRNVLMKVWRVLT